MAEINPHINFNGNAEEAFTFYQSAFNGELKRIVRFKDLAGPDFQVPKDEEDQIMHIELHFGRGSILMANDVPKIMGRTNEKENRSKIVVNAESKEEADSIFNKLSQGAEIEMPLEFSPWGSYFGMFRDKYGIEWMIEYRESK